jgi:hypothetical protein
MLAVVSSEDGHTVAIFSLFLEPYSPFNLHKPAQLKSHKRKIIPHPKFDLQSALPVEM